MAHIAYLKDNCIGHLELAPIESTRLLSYNEALIYCQFLNINDKRDWRLPSWDEFCSIRKYIARERVHLNTMHAIYWVDDGSTFDIRYNNYKSEDYLINADILNVRPIRTLYD